MRALDLRLLLDLLTIETDPERWKSVTIPVVSHIEDLLLVGDFEGALQLTEILTTEAKGDGDRKPAAADGAGPARRRRDDDARRHTSSIRR